MIDPKELHIGAHINANGKRVVVDQIFRNGIVAYIAPNGEWNPIDSSKDWIQPIPITTELLEELGFVKMEEHGTVSVWMNRNIRIDFYGTRITAMVGNDYNKCTINPIFHLHELEAFLYLTTKNELIKE